MKIICSFKTARAVAAGLAVAASVASAVPAGAVDLLQGAWVPNSNRYEWRYRSIPSIPVRGAPFDVDWNRWAMLHDGSVYRLYAFKAGSRNTIYQFGFNRATNAYEWGHRSIRAIRIVGAPRSASSLQFAMLHDGRTFRLYLQDRFDPRLLHQFGFNRSTSRYEYGFNSIPRLRVVGFPADTDWRRWAMSHDGRVFRFYAFRRGSGTQVYQAGYDARSRTYRFGFRSIRVLNMVGFPQGTNRWSFAMLHDRRDYRVYFKNR